MASLYRVVATQLVIRGANLLKRLRKYNSDHKGFRVRANNLLIFYYEAFKDKRTAMLREKEIKAKKEEKYIEKLIAGSEHPSLYQE